MTAIIFGTLLNWISGFFKFLSIRSIYIKFLLPNNNRTTCSHSTIMVQHWICRKRFPWRPFVSISSILISQLCARRVNNFNGVVINAARYRGTVEFPGSGASKLSTANEFHTGNRRNATLVKSRLKCYMLKRGARPRSVTSVDLFEANVEIVIHARATRDRRSIGGPQSEFSSHDFSCQSCFGNNVSPVISFLY